MNPVTLYSTLEQPSLSPGDIAASFYCAVTGSQLVWLINDDRLAFVASTDIYENKNVNGFVATLLKKTAQEDQYNFISQLHIINSNMTNLTVQCYNGSLNTLRSINYLHTGKDAKSIVHMHRNWL